MELLAVRRGLRWLIGVACAAGIVAASAPVPAAEPPPSEVETEGTRGALRLAWRADLGRNLARALAADDSCVAAATREHDCVLLRLADGSIVWRARRKVGVSGGLALTERSVLGVSDAPESQIFRLDRAQGREVWHAPFGEVWARPAVGDTAVYAATVAGEVRSVSLRDGHTHWIYSAPAFVRAPLVLAQGLLLVPTQGDSLIALDAGSGAVRWGLAPGGALWGAPVVAGGRAWCLSYEGTLTAFDLNSGEVRERAKLDGLFRCGLAGPDPLLALATDGRLEARDPHSLDLLWERDLGGIGELSPAPDSELVWVALQDGTVRVLRSRDGRDVAKLPVPAPAVAPVVIRGRSILIGAGRGEVIAYRWFGGLPPRTVNRAPGIGASGVPLLFSGGFAAPGPAVGGPVEAARVTTRWEGTEVRSSRSGGFGRWIWTAGWVVGSVAALWLQQEADDAYDSYRVQGRPDLRERYWSRAERYDRGVVASWIASEACFALAVRAWLRSAPGDGGAQ